MKFPMRITALGISRGSGRRSVIAPALLAGLAALFAASCAKPIKIDAAADPLAILGPGSLAYARLSGRAARELAPALLPPSQASSMKGLLERTRVAAIGVGSAEEIGSDTHAGGIGRRSFRAVLIGDYPFRTASLSLGTNPDWKRVKPAYYNAKLGLYAAVPGPQLVLASSGPLDPLIAAAKAPGPSPIPPRLSELASRELVLWAPEPFSGLAAGILGEEMDIPARGLLIAASPLPGEDGRYEATIVFMMEDAAALKAFRPVLKLAWYGIARLLLGDEAESALVLPVRTDGEIFAVSGVPLTSGSLARVLGILRADP